MKTIILGFMFLLLFSTTIEAKKSYRTLYHSKKVTRYYSNWHLNRIEKRILWRSDIDKRAVRRVFAYYKKNRYRLKLSKRYLAIADYTKTSNKKRLYIIDLRDGTIHRHYVAHGKRSGAKGGRVWRSSNRLNSHMTPYGFFKVGNYEGITARKRYNYLPIKGLERTNAKVGLPTRYGGRDVVVHTASYVKRGGRSHGCFAIMPQDRGRVFKKLKQALLYSYTGR